MMATVGIDLAKTVLHAVAMDAGGKVMQRRTLDRFQVAIARRLTIASPGHMRL